MKYHNDKKPVILPEIDPLDQTYPMTTPTHEEIREWTEEEKKISDAWWNYWNYQGNTPDRDLIEKFWFGMFKKSLLSTQEEVKGEIEKDEEFTYPDPKHMFLAGNAKGDNEEIRWAKHCVDKNANRNIERAIRNEEHQKFRQLLSSKIEQLRQNK